MQNQNLFLRNDTILGVCEAIGREFGFHPNWLRVGLAFALFFAPFAVIGGYVALAIPIALARWIYPVPSESVSDQAGPVTPEAALEQDEEESELPLAA